MKALIDIPNAKAPYSMDVLQHISYVKVKPITNEKALRLSEIKELKELLECMPFTMDNVQRTTQRPANHNATYFSEIIKDNAI